MLRSTPRTAGKQRLKISMRQLAAAAVNKLQAMTDSEFSEREFILTDEE